MTKSFRNRKSGGTGKLLIGDGWDVITIIAGSPSNSLKAVAEFVENSIDAKAKNLRGNIVPFSLLKATKALSCLGRGQRLEILATDEQTQKGLLEPHKLARSPLRAVAIAAVARRRLAAGSLQILDHDKFRMVKLGERKTFYKIFFEKTSS